MNTSSIPTGHVLATAKVIKFLAYAIALIGTVASYGTQVVLLLSYDVGNFSYILPATIDLLAICAALALQLPDLDRVSRWIAGSVLTIAVAVSVAANLTGGHNPIAQAAHAWPVVAYLLGELLANRVRAYAARVLAASTVDTTPVVPVAVPQPPAAVPASAPVSPGMPPVQSPTVQTVAAVVEEDPAAIAFRAAQVAMRKTSKLPALNGSANGA